jgi:hypothetical protein
MRDSTDQPVTIKNQHPKGHGEKGVLFGYGSDSQRAVLAQQAFTSFKFGQMTM